MPVTRGKCRGWHHPTGNTGGLGEPPYVDWELSQTSHGHGVTALCLWGKPVNVHPQIKIPFYYETSWLMNHKGLEQFRWYSLSRSSYVFKLCNDNALIFSCRKSWTCGSWTGAGCCLRAYNIKGGPTKPSPAISNQQVKSSELASLVWKSKWVFASSHFINLK